MAAQLAERASDLARMGKWQRRRSWRLVVEPVDLKVERRLLARVELVDELADRLGAIWLSVVDGLRTGH